MKKKYVGSNFDEFLKHYFLLRNSTAIAQGRILIQNADADIDDESDINPPLITPSQKSKGIRNP